MNITRIHALHTEIQKVVEQIKSKEFRLIQLLQQLDREFGYKALGYASLWEYAVRGLGMTESQASSYIAVSRVLGLQETLSVTAEHATRT